MDHRVLHLGYDALGRPIVPGASRVIRCAANWWTVYGQPVDRVPYLLGYLWEVPTTTGLFGVHAEVSDWSVVDPSSQGVSLASYFADNDDWLICRFDGTDLFPVVVNLVAPAAIGSTPFTIVSWEAEEGDDLAVDQNVVTIKRDSTTIQVKCVEGGKLITKKRKVGEQVTALDDIAELERRERLTASRKVVKLLEKPRKMPTVLKPLELGDAIITNLYPSILGTIGEGDRVSEAEGVSSKLH